MELNPRELAVALLPFSPAKVQVVAIITDADGRLVSVGINHGDANGNGVHAEEDAISRADRTRLRGAHLTVAGRRKKSGNWVYSRPCENKKPHDRSGSPPCLLLALSSGIETVEYTTKTGEWEELRLQFVRVR